MNRAFIRWAILLKLSDVQSRFHSYFRATETLESCRSTVSKTRLNLAFELFF
jgi:hypothetical protein